MLVQAERLDRIQCRRMLQVPVQVERPRMKGKMSGPPGQRHELRLKEVECVCRLNDWITVYADKDLQFKLKGYGLNK